MKLIVEKWIIKSGLKKRNIAEKVGVNENTLTNWMKNRSWPRLDQAVILLRILNKELPELKLEDLYKDDESEPRGTI